MMVNKDIRLPDGYFEDLKGRLSALPYRSSSVKRNAIHSLAPYLAIAACMVIGLVLGNLVLPKPAYPEMQADYESMLVADVLRDAVYYDNFMGEETAEGVSDDDIIEYLVGSGMSVEQFNFEEYEQNR